MRQKIIFLCMLAVGLVIACDDAANDNQDPKQREVMLAQIFPKDRPTNARDLQMLEASLQAIENVLSALLQSKSFYGLPAPGEDPLDLKSFLSAGFEDLHLDESQAEIQSLRATNGKTLYALHFAIRHQNGNSQSLHLVQADASDEDTHTYEGKFWAISASPPLMFEKQYESFEYQMQDSVFSGNYTSGRVEEKHAAVAMINGALNTDVATNVKSFAFYRNKKDASVSQIAQPSQLVSLDVE